MLWQLIIDADSDESLKKTITIEAENWFSALRNGLDRYGVDGAVLSSLSCNVGQDKRVTITDSVSNKVYLLEPVERAAESAADAPLPKEQDGSAAPETGQAPASQTADDPAEQNADEPAARNSDEQNADEPAAPNADAPAAPMEAPNPEEPPPNEEAALPCHTVFFIRDEAPDDGSGIFYRERLVAVDTPISKDHASKLAHHYFGYLKSLKRQGDTKLFITVHIYDHAFEERAKRPAVAALTWREWKPDEPQIIFPLLGDEGITFSKAPAQPASSRQTPEPESAVSEMDHESSDVSETMITAFERMQDIYSLRNHDEAAAFVLSLARELIQCHAGCCMLTSPGKYELYVAAAEGPPSDLLKGRTLSLVNGIIGFAAKNSSVVVVNDPQHDERFDEGLDQLNEYQIRNLICAPIQFEGQTVGILELFNAPGDKGFGPNEVNILSYLGTSFAEYVCTSLPSREADFTDKEFSAVFGKRHPIKKPSAKTGSGEHPKRGAPSRTRSKGSGGSRKGATRKAGAGKPKAKKKKR